MTARKAKATPGMSSTNFYQSVIQGTWMNNKKKPFDDPRVRRAVHLALDRPVLVDVVKDVAPMMVGGFIYPFSDFATPQDQLNKRLGYQDDTTAAIKEAKALMAAAGYGSGVKGARLPGARGGDLQAVGAGRPGDAAAGLSIECKLRTAVEFGVVRRRQVRQLRSRRSAPIVSTLLDPSDYFNAWYKKDGPQNYSFWDNKKFNDAAAADRPRGRRQEAARR